MTELGGPFQAIGEALQEQAYQMFHWRYRLRDGTLVHTTFASYMWSVQSEVEQLLDAGQTSEVPKTERVCREILKPRQGLWTFVRHDGIEPPNSAAERAIRPEYCGARVVLGPTAPRAPSLWKR
jgi:transposase